MSGIMTAVYGAGTGPGSGAINNPLAGGTFAENETVSLVFNTDGTIQINGDLNSGTDQYFTPTTTGIGSTYYAKCVKSGTATGSGSAFSTVLQLNAIRTWTASTVIGVARAATFVVTIYSDAGGTNQVSTGTYNFTLDGL